MDVACPLSADPKIEHIRDTIHDDDGAVLEVYNHLIYRFGTADPWVARAYLDEPGTVSIMQEGNVPADVMAYLQDRFDTIQQLGQDGYQVIWSA